MHKEPPGNDQGGDTTDHDQEGALPSGCDYAVRMFDADAFNATWSGLRPGADYVQGSREAERVAAMVRVGLLPYLKHRTALDAVLAMTDLDGNPSVWVKLGAAATVEVVELARDGLRARGELADDLN
jgi:hypothetical protein